MSTDTDQKPSITAHDVASRAANAASQFEAATKHLSFVRRSSAQRSPDLPESAMSLYTKQDVNTEADEFRNLMSESKHGTAEQ